MNFSIWNSWTDVRFTLIYETRFIQLTNLLYLHLHGFVSAICILVDSFILINLRHFYYPMKNQVFVWNITLIGLGIYIYPTTSIAKQFLL